MPAAEFHYNPLGSVHGGIIATLLDTAAGCTVHSTLPAGVGYTSLDLMTRFIKPVTTKSGLLRCEGTIISRGRRTAVAESRLFDERGTLLAQATSTCLIFEILSRLIGEELLGRDQADAGGEAGDRGFHLGEFGVGGGDAGWSGRSGRRRTDGWRRPA
jgi:uncharacterized protein (TIGR00369 family)